MSKPIQHSISQDILKRSYELSNLRIARFYQKIQKQPEQNKDIQNGLNSTSEKVKSIESERNKEKYKYINGENVLTDDMSCTKERAMSQNNKGKDSDLMMENLPSSKSKKGLTMTKSLKNRLVASIPKTPQFLEDANKKKLLKIDNNNNNTLIDNSKNVEGLEKANNTPLKYKFKKCINNIHSSSNMRLDSGYSSYDNIDDTSDDANDINYSRFKNKLKKINHSDIRNIDSLISASNDNNSEKASISVFLNQEEIENLLQESNLKGDHEACDTRAHSTTIITPCKDRNVLQKDNSSYSKPRLKLFSSPRSTNRIDNKYKILDEDSYSNNNKKDLDKSDLLTNSTCNRKYYNNTFSPLSSTQVSRHDNNRNLSLESKLNQDKDSEVKYFQTLNNLSFKLSLWKTNQIKFPNTKVDQLTTAPQLFEIKESDKIDEDILSTCFDKSSKTNLLNLNSNHNPFINHLDRVVYGGAKLDHIMNLDILNKSNIRYSVDHIKALNSKSGNKPQTPISKPVPSMLSNDNKLFDQRANNNGRQRSSTIYNIGFIFKPHASKNNPISSNIQESIDDIPKEGSENLIKQSNFINSSATISSNRQNSNNQINLTHHEKVSARSTNDTLYAESNHSFIKQTNNQKKEPSTITNLDIKASTQHLLLQNKLVDYSKTPIPLTSNINNPTMPSNQSLNGWSPISNPNTINYAPKSTYTNQVKPKETNKLKGNYPQTLLGLGKAMDKPKNTIPVKKMKIPIKKDYSGISRVKIA